MAHDLIDWMNRIKAVEREHLAARFAIDQELAAAKIDPTLLKNKLQVSDLHIASDHLNGTYLIRLFAEFESGLRAYWLTFKTTHSKTADLLDGIAARRKVSQATLESAHTVRAFRNAAVHEREDDDGTTTSLSKARSHLCTFFSFLPRRW